MKQKEINEQRENSVVECKEIRFTDKTQENDIILKVKKLVR